MLSLSASTLLFAIFILFYMSSLVFMWMIYCAIEFGKSEFAWFQKFKNVCLSAAIVARTGLSVSCDYRATFYKTFYHQIIVIICILVFLNSCTFIYFPKINLNKKIETSNRTSIKEVTIRNECKIVTNYPRIILALHKESSFQSDLVTFTKEILVENLIFV